MFPKAEFIENHKTLSTLIIKGEGSKINHLYIPD